MKKLPKCLFVRKETNIFATDKSFQLCDSVQEIRLQTIDYYGEFLRILLLLLLLCIEL